MLSDQEKQNSMTIHNRETAKSQDKIHVDDYISQFLILTPSEKSIEKPKTTTIVIENQESSKLSSSSEYLSSEVRSSDFQQSPQLNSKRSPLHNFQKHFVTTIRQNVKIEWGDQSIPHLQAAKEIWQIFKNSQKYTKEFVSLILGQNKEIVDEIHLKKYGLMQCYSKYGEETYILAQNELRKHVLQAFQNTPKSKIMYERRIAKKEQFANYFFKVLAEIEDGMMHKRLPKRRPAKRRVSKN